MGGLYNTRQIKAARAYYRRWRTEPLTKKRLRLTCRLLGLEQVLAERGLRALPPAMVEALRLWTTPAREE